MGFGNFIKSSVMGPIFLLKRLIEKPKNKIKEIVFNSTVRDSNKSIYEFDLIEPLCPDIYEANLQLRYYLFRWFTPKNALKLERSCHSFITRLEQNSELPLDGMAALVNYFYDTICEQAGEYDLVAPGFFIDDFLEQVENFVCVSCYKSLFCSRTDEEKEDLLLQNHIRSLYWITQGFLETVLKLELKIVNDLIDDAIFEISRINSHKKIKDKLYHLVKCTEKISEAIRSSTGKPASADDFIPALIYVIVRSNPPLIQSNLWFIRRFSFLTRTTHGESGYQFTNMCSAIQFIKELNAQRLHMSDELFEVFVSENTPS